MTTAEAPPSTPHDRDLDAPRPDPLARPALSPLALSARLLGLGLLLFALARILLLVGYREHFVGLTAAQVVEAFAVGLRYDLAALSWLLGAQLALLAVPVPAARARAWRRAWTWLAFAPLLPCALLLGADLLYFAEVRRHLGREPYLLGNDVGFLVAMARVHAAAAAGCLGVVAALAWAWRGVSQRPVARPRAGAVVAAAWAAALVLAARGSVDRKPLSPLDAYRGRGHDQANLALNGVYTVLRAALEPLERPDNPLGLDEACAALGLDPRAPFPALRQAPAPSPTGPGRSVVLLLLESWDVRYSGTYGGAPHAVTPCFDALAEESVVFERLYAATQRTIGGVQAALTGVPCVSGVPELGRGLEHVAVTRAAALARSRGYRTFFLQAPRRRSYYLDSVMLSLGFERAYGLEDVPVRRAYPDPDPKWGWDYDALQEAVEQIDALEGAPCFVVLLTGTSHSPYADPGREFHRLPHAVHATPGYVNTLAYSDWAVGEFMRAARSRPWYARTTFVLAADHVYRSISEDLPENFRIPALIHGAPGVEPRRDREVRSQLDLLPTLIELMGLPGGHAGLGASLLGPSPGRALVRLGDQLGLITSEGWVTSAGGVVLAARPAGLPAPARDRMHRELLALQRVAVDLTVAGRWAPPLATGD